MPSVIFETTNKRANLNAFRLHRVRNVTGLRVADASVMPTPVSGTPNTVLMAIGERAADLILIDNAHSMN